MAIACLGLVTFLPLRNDFSLPCFISRISRSTFLPAEGEYLRSEDFLERDFLAVDVRELFFALPAREEPLDPLREVRDLARPLIEVLPDFLLVAFLVAMTILLGGQMAGGSGQVVSYRSDAEREHYIFCHTTRRTPGRRTRGSAMSHAATCR